MSKEFSEATKHIADELIDLSRMLDKKMETWSDNIARYPNSPNKGVSEGFINKESDKPGVDLVIDVLAPPNEQKALLRTWGIECVPDSDGNERFNNIQLSYVVDHATARQLVEKGQKLTRDDIAKFLHSTEHQLDRLVISDQTGRDKSSQELLGKRYDLDAEALGILTKDERAELMLTMEKVLERLKQSAHRTPALDDKFGGKEHPIPKI